MRGVYLAGLLALAGQAHAQGAPAADTAAGQQVYETRCSFCHGEGGVGGQGPSLVGVAGRKAAIVPNFAYTAALKASGLTWTSADLDRFLTNPDALVPGTAMPMSVPDAKERADLIAYLASLH
ncbi:MAG TPA: c-type cytochrome [Caulobacteraceae bacterium]|nr:c-type cytochrome [Caulobacteraceae bacterium]